MDHSVLLAVAAGGEHPLIDLDFTAAIQLVIFIMTGLIATRLLFRPYLKMKDARFSSIEGARDEAERLTAEGETALSGYEEKLGAARRRADEERRKIRADAAANQREVEQHARAEAQAAMEAAHREVEGQSQAARAELLPRADELGRVIAGKLLGREVA
ncbi:MAG TPA: hypothetical protein VFG83_16105 [Kofleriaceae bacterium]|nr:hypothetical protein [Kofleriaceae bacterium]